MSILPPENTNFLQGHSFDFQVNSLPNTTFFVQRVNVPGVNIGSIPVPYATKAIPESGDEVEYSILSVTFKVDEELQSFFEVFDWIVGLGGPISPSQYRKLLESERGRFSDGSLTIRNSKKNPILRLNFKSLFPTSLSDMELMRDTSDIPYPIATLSLVYIYYTYERI